MWSYQAGVVEKDKTIEYQVFYKNKALNFCKTLTLWQESKSFVRFFINIMSSAPWPAFYWEMPPLTYERCEAPAKFILMHSPQLARVQPDFAPFSEYFRHDGQLLATFENLGGDASLLVPAPLAPDTYYTHLARFARHAPEEQQNALFRQLGITVERMMGKRPLWINTSGLGVHWLHIRLDWQPKYYQYRPYCEL